MRIASSHSFAYPPPKPLPRQIPIDGQALTTLPRVRSSEAFGRRPDTGSIARTGPASETLHESRPRNGIAAPSTASPCTREARLSPASPVLVPGLGEPRLSEATP